jgi:hypothetical protein
MATITLTYNETLQNYIDEYFSETKKICATAREIAVWLIRSGKWIAPHDLLIKQCRGDVAQAMREQYITDEHGHSIRAKHVCRIVQAGEQLHMWADIRNVPPRKFMESSVQQRRQQIVGECRQLKFDVDFCNDNYYKNDPIQVVFDFTDDIEEAKFPGQYPPKQPR